MVTVTKQIDLIILPSSMTKKNKVKKPLPQPVLNQDDSDNNLVDDLLAQLDSQEREAADLLCALTISESDGGPSTQVQKQDVKSRFKARQVLKLSSSQVGF